jgi:hypothetical protein
MTVGALDPPDIAQAFSGAFIVFNENINIPRKSYELSDGDSI